MLGRLKQEFKFSEISMSGKKFQSLKSKLSPIKSRKIFLLTVIIKKRKRKCSTVKMTKQTRT